MKSNTENALRLLAKWSLAFLLAIPAMAFAGEAAKVTAIWGKVEIDGKTAVIGSAVQEGSSIKTGAEGYIYMKTIDDGLLIVRPNSEARIVTYHVDKKNPANTSIKLELLNGVARSVSGSAVKLARQNFRFNTPVAAIGVRGTDFTVFTTADTTRIAVVEGGVVVSGFDGACSPQGRGPCEGSAATELFARQQGLLLQINKGQNKPQLLQAAAGLAPDAVAPPRPDEPGVKAAAGGSSASVAPTVVDPNLDPTKVGGVKQTVAVGNNSGINTGTGNGNGTGTGNGSSAALTNTIVWGRWIDVLGQGAQFDVIKLEKSGATTVGLNNRYQVSVSKGAEWQVPATGTMGFSLMDSQAVVVDQKGLEAAAKLENGKLQLDFAKSSFATSFDLLTGSERFALQAQGVVGANGALAGGDQNTYPNNMQVNGAVTAEKGGTAAYVFSSRLDNAGNRYAYGVTYWNKK
ncbi:FecR family protein [Undibacterium sp. Di26W]|uniref:FecR family protein n=1 Tax=Undibacterium sp. Di26W TaxID=3413035 RepID=UPI003BF10E68